MRVSGMPALLICLLVACATAAPAQPVPGEVALAGTVSSAEEGAM
jgi:hypothetical protein